MSMSRNTIFLICGLLLLSQAVYSEDPPGSHTVVTSREEMALEEARGDPEEAKKLLALANRYGVIKFVPRKDLSEVEKAYSEALLGERGNTLGNFKYLEQDEASQQQYSKEIKKSRFLLIPTFSTKQEDIRFAEEDKHKIIKMLEEGRQFRASAVETIIKDFHSDYVDQRAAVFRKIDRIVNMLILGDLASRRGERPPNLLEIDDDAMKFFRTWHSGRLPDRTNPFDRDAMKKANAKAENETKIGTELFSIDNFEKRKAKILELLHKAEEELHQPDRLTINPVIDGEFVRAVNAINSTDQFVKSHLKTLNRESPQVDFIFEYFATQGVEIGDVTNRMLIRRFAYLKKQKYVDAWIEAPNETIGCPKGCLMARTSKDEIVKVNNQSPYQELDGELYFTRRKVPHEELAKGPYASGTIERVKIKRTDLVRTSLRELIREIERAQNQKEFNIAIRHYRERLDVAAHSASLASGFIINEKENKVYRDLKWHGWSTSKDYWNKKFRDASPQIKWRKKVQKGLIRVKGLVKTLPRHLRNAVLSMAISMAVHSSWSKYKHGEFPSYINTPVEWVEERAEEISSRIKNSGLLDVDRFSVGKPDLGNSDFEKGVVDKEGRELFEVTKSDGLKESRLYLSIGSSEEHRFLKDASQTTHSEVEHKVNVDSRVNVKTYKGLIPLPTPFVEGYKSTINSINVRNADSGKLLRYSGLKRDVVTGTFYLNNSKGELPKSITYEIVYDVKRSTLGDKSDLRSLDRRHLAKISKQIRAAEFTVIADELDELLRGANVSFSHVEDVLKRNSIYANQPEAEFDSSKIDPNNPFTKYHQYVLNGKLCTQCNTSYLFHETLFTSYFDSLNEEIEAENMRKITQDVERRTRQLNEKLQEVEKATQQYFRDEKTPSKKSVGAHRYPHLAKLDLKTADDLFHVADLMERRQYIEFNLRLVNGKSTFGMMKTFGEERDFLVSNHRNLVSSRGQDLEKSLRQTGSLFSGEDRIQSTGITSNLNFFPKEQIERVYENDRAAKVLRRLSREVTDNLTYYYRGSRFRGVDQDSLNIQLRQGTRHSLNRANLRKDYSLFIDTILEHQLTRQQILIYESSKNLAKFKIFANPPAYNDSFRTRNSYFEKMRNTKITEDWPVLKRLPEDYNIFPISSFSLDPDQTIATSDDYHVSSGVRVGRRLVDHYDATAVNKDKRTKPKTSKRSKTGKSNKAKSKKDIELSSKDNNDKAGKPKAISEGRPRKSKQKEEEHSAKKPGKQDEPSKPKPDTEPIPEKNAEPRNLPPRKEQRVLTLKDRGWIEGDELVEEEDDILKTSDSLASEAADEEVPDKIKLLHEDLHQWRTLVNERLEREHTALVNLIKSSELRNRMSSTNQREVHHLLYRLFNQVLYLARGVQSIDNTFVDPKGKIVSSKEFRTHLANKFTEAERVFLDELEIYMKKPDRVPNSYPYAEAHRIMNRFFVDSSNAISSALDKFPSSLDRATNDEIIQLSDYDRSLDPNRNSAHLSGQRSCISAVAAKLTTFIKYR